MIYLDYSANTPVSPRVLQSFTDAAARYVGNPNSNHPAGLAAKAAIDEATARIAAALGVQPDEIIYTSGASESNNTAIRGMHMTHVCRMRLFRTDNLLRRYAKCLRHARKVPMYRSLIIATRETQVQAAPFTFAHTTVTCRKPMPYPLTP